MPRSGDEIQEGEAKAFIDNQTKETAGPEENKAWVLYAFGACVCFTACNAAISEITNKVGPACIFYFASGSIVTGIVYNIYQTS